MGLSREIVTDERGEFAMPALPTGPYTLKRAATKRLSFLVQFEGFSANFLHSRN